MDPRSLLPHLESPYQDYDSKIAPASEVILAAFLWPNRYWVDLALSWIENGAPINQKIAQHLNSLASRQDTPQNLRHSAFALFTAYLQQQKIEELDVVRVIALHTSKHNFSGSEGVKRAPRIGDLGCVVLVLSEQEGKTAFMVEAVNPQGYTLWVADFIAPELQLISKFSTLQTD